jgi:transcription elongation GreA/GreB family factor
MWRTRFTSGTGGRWLQGLESLPVPRMADAMFELLDSLGKLYGMSMEEKHLKPLESARTALTTQSSAPLLEVLDGADRDEAIRLKGIIAANAGISPALRTQLLGYLRSRHADIFVEQSKEWGDAAVIYTTKAGLQHQQAVLNRIIEEDIPEVAQQIGEAAAHGDLSENAEYTAALEKRDQLASTATRLESELSLARIISPDMAESGFVNVGTRVTVRRVSSGEEEVYTFLGPWDTDVDNRVLNYQAPLSRAFMGARPGDLVTYGEGAEARTWEIVAVEPAALD